MATLVLTNSWQSIAAAKDKLVVQVSDRADLYIGVSTPGDGVPGLDLHDDEVYDFDNLSFLGGNAWIRGAGTVVYFVGSDPA